MLTHLEHLGMWTVLEARSPSTAACTGGAGPDQCFSTGLHESEVARGQWRGWRSSLPAPLSTRMALF